MDNKPEILKIIEAGLEGDTTKLRAYTNLLIGKCPDDEAFQNALVDRLIGAYKKKDVLKF